MAKFYIANNIVCAACGFLCFQERKWEGDEFKIWYYHPFNPKCVNHGSLFGPSEVELQVIGHEAVEGK